MNEDKNEYKLTWKSWLALIFLCIAFSGIFAKNPTALRAFDFTALLGKVGTIAGSKNTFLGAGGIGAREGLIFAITLIPTVMLALGLIQACEALGALRAAEKLFRPLLRPFLGIPGVAGLAFVSSFTSSDVGAVMSKDLVETGLMTDDERTIFVGYQYAGSGTIGNVSGAGAPLLAISVLPIGIIILLIVIVKIIGANLLRLYLKFYRRKHPVEGGSL